MSGRRRSRARAARATRGAAGRMSGGTAGRSAAPPSGGTAAERLARRLVGHDERLLLAAEVVMGPHPVLSQMLYSLTMGGPRPRTQRQLLEPHHGIAVLTDRRLFVVANGRTVMEVPPSGARVEATGGGPLMPWADVRWGSRLVRTSFHWGRSKRDRFVAALEGG